MLRDKIKKIMEGKMIPMPLVNLWLEAVNYLDFGSSTMLINLLIKLSAKEAAVLSENLARKIMALKERNKDLWNQTIQEEIKFVTSINE